MAIRIQPGHLWEEPDLPLGVELGVLASRGWSAGWDPERKPKTQAVQPAGAGFECALTVGLAERPHTSLGLSLPLGSLP